MKTIVILSHVGFDNSPYCNYVHEHAKALVKQGYKVIVLAAIVWLPILSKFQKRKKEFMKRMQKSNKIQMVDGVEVRYIKIATFSNLLYNSKINLNGISYYNSIKKIFKKIYKEENVVLLDAHTFKVEGYVAYKLKKKYPKIFTTVTLHGTSFDRNVKSKNGIKQIKKVFNKVNYAICVSSKIERMLNNVGVYNSTVIFNGINQYGIEAENKENCKFKIISVGSLDINKKHDITINVIKKLSKKYSSIHLDIIGSGIQKSKLEQLAKKLDISDNVEFKGKISNLDVQKIMNKSYIFILPSIKEGFGIVYPEAMNAGCITIGTKNEGIDGFIKNGINGFLVNSDVDEITKLIEDIYENKYDINKIRKTAIEDSKKLTWEKNAENYMKLYIERNGENNDKKS